MRIFILFIGSILLSLSSLAQTRIVSGSVTDTSGAPLQDATINLKSGAENLSSKTNGAGKFQFPTVTATEFIITITSVGFENYVQSYIAGSKDAKAFLIDPIRLRVKSSELAEVVITANPITIREDTVEYRASAYKVREGAPVEDVIKKLPGVTVDKDGVITAQGKEIKRVRVNGKDYFGGDVVTATQNLPADIIENLQIIDDYGDKANQTGIKEGEPEKILNINVQRGKNKGSFGNGMLAGGTEERFLARVNANNFNEDRQISFLGSINNTNANSFNFNGGGRGGGARGANFGSGERGGGGGDGRTLSESFGLNYRNKWGKKITSYGSYSFSGRKNNTVGTSFQQDLDSTRLRTIRRSSENDTKSWNHRVTWNFEYNIDSSNYLKLTPYYSYASSENASTSVSEINRPKYFTNNNSQSTSKSTTPAYGSDLFFIHRFRKRGRNFNVSATMNYSKRDQDRFVRNNYYNVDTIGGVPTVSLLDQNQLIGIGNINTTTNIRLSFAEPIGKYTALEASYTWNNSTTKSIRDVDDIDSITGEKVRNVKQSNNYDYEFITNRYGLNLHTNKSKYNYMIGMVIQPSVLTGMDKGRNITTRNTNMNYAPSARFMYKFSRTHSLTANYGGSSREPNFTQLQPVVDSSNVKNIVIGNPTLRPEFANRFGLQYNKVNVTSGTSLFVNLSFDQTLNRIVSSRVDDTIGTGRTTSYLNTDGFYGYNANFSISQPFAKKRITATVSGNANFDNNISFINNIKYNGQNWTLRPGARLRFDYPDIIDVSLNGSYNINKSLISATNSYNSATTLNFGIEGKNYFFKNWTLGYDLNKSINSGFNTTRNANPTILNVYGERRFLKNNRATIRLQAFDLFNENTGITREINGQTIIDYQNSRLGRYFLLGFNLRLQKFTGGRLQRVGGNNQNRGERTGGGNGQGNGGGGRNTGGSTRSDR